MAEAGAGHYRYEVEDNWGRLPDGWTFGNVTGVAVDSQGRVIICQQQMDPPVIVFDREGNYLNSWGSGLIPEPHTLFIDADDIVYVPDRVDHVAMKFTMDGELLLEMGNRGQPSDTGCTEPEGVVLRAGSAVQHAHPRLAFSVRQPLRLRRLQELPRPPVFVRRRPHLLLGKSRRHHSGKHKVAPQSLGDARRQYIRVRPVE